MPFVVSRHSDSRHAQGPRGLTLLELLVALVLLGGMVALVAPAMVTPGPTTSDVMTVVRTARSAAIARSEPLVLTVGATGEWAVRPLPPDDQRPVLQGTVATPPVRVLRLQVSPLGACIPLATLPPSLAGWDAASCTAASATIAAASPKRAGGA